MSTSYYFWYVGVFRHFTCLFWDSFENCTKLVLWLWNFFKAPYNPQLSFILNPSKAAFNLAVKGGLKLSKLRKIAKNWFFQLRHPGTWILSKILIWLLCQIYTIYITENYLKHENKTDNHDFGKFGMKIGPVLYLQELPCFWKKSWITAQTAQFYKNMHFWGFFAFFSGFFQNWYLATCWCFLRCVQCIKTLHLSPHNQHLE